MKFNFTIKSIVPLTILLLFTSGDLLSQSLQVEDMERPKLFNDGLVTKEMHDKYLVNPNADYQSSELSAGSGYPWKVWSDRQENPLFEQANYSSNTVAFLDFMQELYVLDTNSEGWVKVRSRKAGGTTQVVGWIQGRYLQLSPYALANNGISRKALVLPDGDAKFSLDTMCTSCFEDLTRVYDKPKMDLRNTLSGTAATQFDIFFIVKETEDFYLLSKHEDFKTARDPLYGWMPKLNITQWNSRVCYGPNYGQDAMKDYPNDLPFTNNQSKLKSLAKWNPSRNADSDLFHAKGIRILDDYPASNPYSVRYPDLTPLNMQYDNVRSVQLIIASSSVTSLGIYDIEDIMIEIEELKALVSHINLIFVVDATSSMKRYYPDIAEAIDNICTTMDDYFSFMTVNVTIGFYRDYADGNNLEWEVLETSSYHPKMTDNLKSVSCKSKGKDWYEAVYNGILKTFEESPKIKKDQQNFVVLIGDDGNDPNDPIDATRFDEIAKKFSEYKVKLYAFQATTRYTDASLQFQKDALSWINGIKEDATNKRNFKIEALDDNNASYGIVNKSGALNDYGMTYGKLTTNSSTPGVGTDPEILQTRLQSDIISWVETVDNRIQELISGIGDGSLEDCKQRKIDAGLSEEAAEFLCSRRDQSIGSYTVVKSPHVDSDCLLPYVLLTYEEYASLIVEFENFSNAVTDAQKQEQLSLLFYSLIGKAFGSNANTIAKLENKTLGDLWRQLFQVELGIKELRNLTIDELAGAPPEIITDLQNSVDAFMDISIEEMEWRRLSGNQQFYWIPAQEFPGYRE